MQLIPALTRHRKEDNLSQKWSEDIGGFKGSKLALDDVSDASTKGFKPKAKPDTLSQSSSIESANIQSDNALATTTTSTSSHNKLVCTMSVIEATGIEDVNGSSSPALVRSDLDGTHKASSVVRTNEIVQQGAVLSSQKAQKQKLRRRRIKQNLQPARGHLSRVMQDAHILENVHKIRKGLHGHLLLGPEDPVSPILIPGHEGVGWRGKGKGLNGYAADEDRYSYSGSYTQTLSLQAGRNPSGGGNDPNGENSHSYGSGWGDRGGGDDTVGFLVGQVLKTSDNDNDLAIMGPTMLRIVPWPAKFIRTQQLRLQLDTMEAIMYGHA